MPTWLQPAQAGLTSNALPTGAPTGMNVPMQVRYRSPAGPADGPADVRVQVTQTKLRGVATNPTRYYDSGWNLSGGIASPMPSPVTSNPRGAAYYGGRVYVLDNSTYNTVWSASVDGLNVGSWRAELSPGWEYNLTGDICVVGNFLYLMVAQNWFAFNGGLIYSQINADGTLGGWAQPAWFDTGLPVTAGSFMVSLDKGVGAGGASRGGFLFWVFGNGTTGTAKVEVDGTVTTYWVPGPTLPSGAGWYGAGHADRSGHLYIVPGGTTATYWTSFDYATGQIGAWSNGPALPVEVHQFAFASPPEAVTGPGARNNSDGDVMWVIYGFHGSGNANATNQVLWNSAGRFRSGFAWWQASLHRGTPAWGCAGTCWPVPNQDIRNTHGYAVGVFGGWQHWDGSHASLPVEQPQVFYPAGNVGGFGPWPVASSAPGDLLTPPSGGTLVQEPDGSWDYGFTIPTPNLTPWGGPYDGDEFTVSIQFVSQLSGDPSPAALTSYRYGKPPTIRNFVPSGAVQHGNPTLNWQFQPGTQGGYQASWRVQVYAGPTLVADSGIRKDTLTSWTPDPAPRFFPGAQYTATLTVTSTDTPLGPSDTNQATATASFIPQYTPILPASGLTASTDSQRCAIVASWTNPAGTAFNRIYYRRTPPTAVADQTWYLLHDMVAAQPGPASSVLMDQLAMLASYDVAVSCLDLTGNQESPLTSSLAVNGDAETAGAPESPPSQTTVFADGFAYPGTPDLLLWRSLGTDATGTLDAWSVDVGSATIQTGTAQGSDALLLDAPQGLPLQYGGQFSGGYQAGSGLNVATLTPGTIARAGHPEWRDVAFLCRFTISTGGGGWPRIMTHVRNSSNWVGAGWRPTGPGGPALVLDKVVGGIYSVVASVRLPSMSGSHWLWLWSNGTTYQAQILADAGGAEDVAIATVSGVVTDPALQKGQVAIGNDARGADSVQFGGPYPNVCRVNGPAPYGNAPLTTTSAVGEPAYAWIDQTPQGGNHVVSIYQGPHQTPVGSALWQHSPEYAGIPAQPLTDYTISATIHVTDVPSSGGATLTVEEFDSSGSQTLSGEHTIVTPLVTGTSGPVTMTGRITTGSTTSSIAIRPTLYGTGQANFAWLWATKVSLVAPLFSSLGTDGAGSLAWWTQASGASWGIVNNVATGTGLMTAGHPDWTDVVFQARFQWGPHDALLLDSPQGFPWQYGTVFSGSGEPAAWIRRNGTNGVRVHTDGGWLYLNKSIEGTLTQISSALASLVQGSWYWYQITAQGSTFTATLYTDLGGAPWAVVATCSWQAEDSDASALVSGQIGLDSANPASASFGGQYPQVCTVTPASNAVADWLPVSTLNGGEPAYAWDRVTAYSGSSSLSVYAPSAAPQSTQGQWATMLAGESQAVAVQPGTAYTVTAELRAAAVAGTGAYLDVVEWDAAGILVREWGSVAQMGGPVTGYTGGGSFYGGSQYGGARYGGGEVGWQLVTASGTTGGNTAHLSVRCRLAGTGTAWFDQILVRETVTAQSMTQRIPWPVTGYPGLIHVAGQGDTWYARLPLGSYMRSNQGGPQVTTTLEAQTVPVFGNSAPAVRYGLQKWRAVALTIEHMDGPAGGWFGQNGVTPTLNEFVNLRDYAYEHGLTLYYRDSSGRMMTCAFDPKHALTHEPASYTARREMTNTMNEIANHIPPYVAQGFVLGKFTLLNGSVPHLDPSEQAG